MHSSTQHIILFMIEQHKYTVLRKIWRDYIEIWALHQQYSVWSFVRHDWNDEMCEIISDCLFCLIWYTYMYNICMYFRTANKVVKAHMEVFCWYRSSVNYLLVSIGHQVGWISHQSSVGDHWSSNWSSN